jgi:hypothetical protein
VSFAIRSASASSRNVVDLDVARDLLELRRRDLGAELRLAVARAALADRADSLERPAHELVVDPRLRSARAKGKCRPSPLLNA